MRQRFIKKTNLFTVLPTIGLIVVSFLIVTGCDEAGMMKPVVPVDDTDPVDPVDPTDPTTNGEVKQPEEPGDPTEPEEPEPMAEPTVVIESAAQQDDGSITVSGTTTDVVEGTTVTVTLDDTVTATTTTDSAGAWTVTVPATDAEVLTAGTVTIIAAAADATATGTVEYTVQTTYGIPTPTEEERIQVEIVAEVWGFDTTTEDGRIDLKFQHEVTQEVYGEVFEVAYTPEQGQELYQGFVEYKYKKKNIPSNISSEKRWELIDQYFEEAYGITREYSKWLVYEIYLSEKPEDEYLLGILWQTDDIALEYLLLRTANPGATEEEILELLRESIHNGRVTIAL